jgi:hypothetical protein
MGLNHLGQMTDFIDEAFAHLDAYYPNSKRKRRVTEPTKSLAVKDWDSRPTSKTLPNGKDIDMYTINALASALNRPVATLRLWMQEGHLPAAPYRLPAKQDKNGKERPGRRLYSRQMIEAAVEIFHCAGFLHAPRVEWALNQQITVDLTEAWNKIRAEETN